MNLKEKLKKQQYKEIWQQYCGFLDLSMDGYMKIQRRLMEEQIQLWSNCGLGQSILKGKHPRNLDEFRKMVPLTEYEDYADILLTKQPDMLPGNPVIWIQTTWEGGKHPIKVAPYTRSMLDTYRNNVPACLILSTSRKKGSFDVASTDKFLYALAPLPYATGLFPLALGEEIDIHAGGEDLVFPHHENEIAQSEAANGKEFSRYWMHNGFLNIDNRKMSKSLGNIFTVREISEKYDLQVLRFFMLSAHYRSPLNFSAELMEAAKSGLERIITAADRLKFLMGSAKTEDMAETEAEKFAKSAEYVGNFESAMDDDFNTADAIAAVFDLVKFINTMTDEDSSKEYLENLFDRLVRLTEVLGIIVDKEDEILDSDIEALIAERQAARKEKNFARADEIRDELLAKGIVLKDTREGVQWKRA